MLDKLWVAYDLVSVMKFLIGYIPGILWILVTHPHKQGVCILASNELDAQKNERRHADPPFLVRSVGEYSSGPYHVGIKVKGKL